MTSEWLSKRLLELSRVDAYIKPATDDRVIKMDANENLALSPQFLNNIVTKAVSMTDLRYYPAEELEIFCDKLSQYLKISKKHIAVGNGSDQIIESLLSTVGKQTNVTIVEPTFSYFINRCKMHNVSIKSIPLNKNDNSIPLSGFMNSARKSNIVYICSPNNPTGNQFDKEIMLDIIESLSDTLIIADEAYVEFGNYSLSQFVTKYDNLVVLRTMSKAFGLAGARVGYLISQENLAEIFRTHIQSPYPINSLSLTVATIALSSLQYFLEVIQLIRRQRDELFLSLSKMQGIRPFRSDANFIFFESTDLYDSIQGGLRNQSISIKALGDFGRYRGCFRVTVGTEEMNARFISTMRNITSQVG
ncbi:MAG TPA: histidinol-phosphate transaminase [Nitrososphaeraceae archaeon]|jgi:histidinol-phosphate aminotransferase|nr:histidinol-phosphate transaminase [Nitrososphaeraceae archaeon]